MATSSALLRLLRRTSPVLGSGTRLGVQRVRLLREGSRQWSSWRSPPWPSLVVHGGGLLRRRLRDVLSSWPRSRSPPWSWRRRRARASYAVVIEVSSASLAVDGILQLLDATRAASSVSSTPLPWRFHAALLRGTTFTREALSLRLRLRVRVTSAPPWRRACCAPSEGLSLVRGGVAPGKPRIATLSSAMPSAAPTPTVAAPASRHPVLTDTAAKSADRGSSAAAAAQRTARPAEEASAVMRDG